MADGIKRALTGLRRAADIDKAGVVELRADDRAVEQHQCAAVCTVRGARDAF